MTSVMPTPTFSPAPDTTLDNEGREIEFIARALGKPLMPWQRHVATIATEKTPDGRYKYPIVLVTVPRQSGKTTLLAPIQINRILHNPGIRCFYTAQTGKDARSRFKDLAKLIQESPLEELFRFRWAAGTEEIQAPNGSSICLFSPTVSALHGETPPLVVLDEIWHHSAAKGSDLMGAIGPAQITLKNRQLWMVSTMGTGQSGFLNDWLARGRAGEPGIALFEWSMNPSNDPYDPVSWEFHPALGHTQAIEDLRAESKRLPRGEWLRAFMNRMTETKNAIIPQEAFNSLPTPTPPTRSHVAVAYDVARDGEAASVVASWRTPTGDPATGLVHRAGGTAWLPDYMRYIAREWKPVVIAADDGGVTRAITAELTSPPPGTHKPITVETITARDLAAACHTWLAAARDHRTLEHTHSKSLSDAVMHAVIRTAGDSWRFSRQHSTGPIDALLASAVALWAFDRHTTLSKPEIRF